MFEITLIYTWIVLILLGFNMGILSGFFGVGGCFILTPLLNFRLTYGKCCGNWLILCGDCFHFRWNQALSVRECFDQSFNHYRSVEFYWHLDFPALGPLSGCTSSGQVYISTYCTLFSYWHSVY